MASARIRLRGAGPVLDRASGRDCIYYTAPYSVLCLPHFNVGFMMSICQTRGPSVHSPFAARNRFESTVPMPFDNAKN